MAKNNSFIYYVITLFVIFLIGYFYSNKSKNNLSIIEERGNIVTAKFLELKRYPKTKNYIFSFYINSKLKTNYIIDAPKDFSSNVGKFYRIKYLEEYPDLIIVKFDQEVTDTSEILNAGFRKEDIISNSYQE